MILSILTPSVPSRLEQVNRLRAMIASQIGELLAVEHLILLDNRRRTIGEKRDNLLRIANGKYVAFVDDDDFVSEDYVERIVARTWLDPDVITFRQQALVNGQTAEIEFRLGNENESFRAATGSVVKRNAWHVCAWRRELALTSSFPHINYGEDWEFAAPLCRVAKTEQHIPKVLHFYRHDARTTEAPYPGRTQPTSFPPPDQFHAATGN